MQDLRFGLSLLERQTAGVDRKHAAYCVGKLVSGFNERMTKDEGALRTEVWMEACGDIPADLWSAATVDLLRGWRRDDHYGRVPEPSDFRAAVQTRLARRLTDLQRCRAMLAKVNAPTEPKSAGPIRVPEPVRLQRILEQQRIADVPDADRAFNMANTERALAFIERRPMVLWAQQFFDERAARDGAGFTSAVKAAARAMPLGDAAPSPTATAALKRSNAAWARKQGRVQYAEQLEREAEALAPTAEEFGDIPEADQ